MDKYLTWGEPPVQVAEKVATVRAAAARKGRRLSFGIRLHAIVRETNAEAWAAADDLIRHLDDAKQAREYVDRGAVVRRGEGRVTAPARVRRR